MIQQDKDCEAFKKWYKKQKFGKDEHCHVFNTPHLMAQEGWQAALAYERADNAPKLTEKEAVEAAAKAICWKEHEGRTGLDSPKEVWSSWHANYETLAEEALRAAGVRFREQP